MSQSASAAISEVLRQPDDLLKLAAYRKKLLKEKSALDAKLAAGVKAQLDATREALLKLQASKAAVGLIREEMMAVEAQSGGQDRSEAFEMITRVSADVGLGWFVRPRTYGTLSFPLTYHNCVTERTTTDRPQVSAVHRNFAQTSKMVQNLRSMSDKVDHLHHLLQTDMSHPLGPAGPSHNLLLIHFQLQQLENFRNETLHQAKKADAAERQVLIQWFEKLDKVGMEFEAWLWEIAGRVIEMVRRGNGGTVVRLLKVVEFEGKEDEKVSRE